MKNFFFFLLILSNFTFAEECAWRWVNPLPQGNDLNDIRFISNNIAFIVGNDATLLKTTDAGLTWNHIKTNMIRNNFEFIFDENNIIFADDRFWVIPSTDSNWSVKTIIKSTDGGKNWTRIKTTVLSCEFGYSFNFLDINNGFYIANDTILKTSNTGISWDTIVPPLPYKKILNTKFFDENTYLFFYKDSILKTTDAGKNWNIISDVPVTNYKSSYFYNSLGFIISDNNLLKTTDAGETWKKIENIPSDTLSRFIFYNENIAWISTINGLLKTTDAGETWKMINTRYSSYPIRSIVDENTAYMWLSLGLNALFKTTDGGAYWKRISSGTGFDSYINTFDVNKEGVFIGVGDCGIIKRTTDDGIHWDAISTGYYQSLNNIQFLDNLNGWAAGNYGEILKTTDGGQTWEEKKSPIITDNIEYFQFFNSNTGITVSHYTDPYNNYLYFYKTTDGGKEWFKISEVTDIYSAEFFFLNEQYGWAVFFLSTGEYSIYNTTDGGQYWRTQKSYQDTSIEKIQFINENIGYALCYNGSIAKTTDSGKNWNTITIDTTEYFRSMHFIDENNGWITSYYGNILKTSDGGNSWEIQFKCSEHFRLIQFLDENNGWAISDDSKSFRTTDGGESWEEVYVGTEKWIYDMIFTTANDGWIVGEDGAMLHYSCEASSIDKEHVNVKDCSDLIIYPNPAKNEVNISLPENQNISSISICNSLGIEVKRIKQAELIRKNKISISISDLPVGLYHCSFEYQVGRITKSFIVLK
ncbi:MAG TPA: YCF48-related protein [Candidatus Kapabacteria bacterium]|nr:YCF48-related protein [Candidatus Kapabacteria bacterium]